MSISMPLQAHVCRQHRFNVGEKVHKADWLGPILPGFVDKARKYLPECFQAAETETRSWEDWVIEMDDYERMDIFRKVTVAYMNDQDIQSKLEECKTSFLRDQKC